MNQKLFERNFCNQSNHCENYMEATTKSTLFAMSEDEWNTKEDTSKYMKNALYVQW